MYLDHFDLQSAPFALTPDTAFTFASRAQQEALSTLLLALDDGAGFVKITGEVGTGKTLACRRLLAALAQRADCDTVYVPNPCLSPRTLMFSIASELGLAVPPHADQHALLTLLNQALLERAAQGRKVFVLLDEAQAMPIDSLESLRLLSNLETEKRKLMQTVLFAQPELDAKLALPDLRQLTTRIVFQYRLDALTRDETERYLAHRLRVAGHRGEPLFAPPVAAAVHRAARGLPRLINLIAHKSLLLAYGEGALRVSKRHVRAAQADTPAAARSGLFGRLSQWMWTWRSARTRRAGLTA